jgi:predicted enzyme related to lactoylglutathione lyase
MFVLAKVIVSPVQTGRGAQTHRVRPMTSAAGAGRGGQSMTPVNRVVHLELRTAEPARARSFYARLFGWRAETIHTSSGDYLTLALGDPLQGGIVEHGTARAFWLPYVEVADITVATEEARVLGASVLLPPREGPAGWRSILASPDGGEIALWQPKG